MGDMFDEMAKRLSDDSFKGAISELYSPARVISHYQQIQAVMQQQAMMQQQQLSNQGLFGCQPRPRPNAVRVGQTWEYGGTHRHTIRSISPNGDFASDEEVCRNDRGLLISDMLSGHSTLGGSWNLISDAPAPAPSPPPPSQLPIAQKAFEGLAVAMNTRQGFGVLMRQRAQEAFSFRPDDKGWVAACMAMAERHIAELSSIKSTLRGDHCSWVDNGYLGQLDGYDSHSFYRLMNQAVQGWGGFDDIKEVYLRANRTPERVTGPWTYRTRNR